MAEPMLLKKTGNPSKYQLTRPFLSYYKKTGRFISSLKIWSFGLGQRKSALPVTVSRRDGVLDYWSDGLSLVNSMHLRISMASVQG
jgi:hypothetical protein